MNGITYTNSSGITKTISQAVLETLYTGSSTWLSVTPTTLPATNLSGDITCNTQIVLQSSTLTLPILEYVISSYNSWIDGLTYATQKATTFTGDHSGYQQYYFYQHK